MRPAIRADSVKLFYIPTARTAALVSGRQPQPLRRPNLWVPIRASVIDRWSRPANIGSTVTSSANGMQTILSDDAEVIFSSDDWGWQLRKRRPLDSKREKRTRD